MTGPLNGGRPGIACGDLGPPAGSESAAARFLQRRFPSVSSGAFAGGRGGTLIFLNSIPALLSVFDFRTGPAIPGGRAVEAKKAAKPFSGFAALTPLCGGAHARNPIFSLQIGNLRVGVGFGKLSLLSVLSSRTEQKRPDFPLGEEKSNLLTQTNAHFRDTYLKPVYRYILSQTACLVKCFAA